MPVHRDSSLEVIENAAMADVTTGDIRSILQIVESRERGLLERLRQLVEVESPSDDKAAVDRAGMLVAEWAEVMGGRAVHHPQAKYGDVLELRFGPEDSGNIRTLLLGHLDTVWPMGTLATMPWREADGKIFGPGVLDMKSWES